MNRNQPYIEPANENKAWATFESDDRANINKQLLSRIEEKSRLFALTSGVVVGRAGDPPKKRALPHFYWPRDAELSCMLHLASYHPPSELSSLHHPLVRLLHVPTTTVRAMPKLATIRLRVLNPDAQKKFYKVILGMRERSDGTMGYAEEEAGLLFLKAKTVHQASDDSLYWKISISVPNIDLAYQQLTDRGIKVTEPRQIGTIAYLAHFSDPEGFAIELLDHWFQGDRPASAATCDTTKLGGGPHLNLLTLRSHSVPAIETAAVRQMGMTPLSIVPAPERGFTLYFYGYETVAPPVSDDLTAVANRTLVYQRPYTVLEVLVPNAKDQDSKPMVHSEGYAGALVTGLNESVEANHLLLKSG